MKLLSVQVDHYRRVTTRENVVSSSSCSSCDTPKRKESTKSPVKQIPPGNDTVYRPKAKQESKKTLESKTIDTNKDSLRSD